MHSSTASAGLAVTVKEQVEGIELAIDLFKKEFDRCRKGNLELNNRLLEVRKITLDGLKDLGRSVAEQLNSYNDSLALQLKLERNELQYLSMQCQSTDEELTQLEGISRQVSARVQVLEQNVGL